MSKRAIRIPQIHKAPPAAAKPASGAAQTAQIELAPAEIRQQWIPGYKGEPLSIWIVRPEHAPAAVPAVMYFHGGAFHMGGFETHERLVRDLVAATRMGFVFVEYSLAPESVFPRAIEEAYGATRYIAAHGAEFGLDGSRLAVAGDCAGANLAAGVALLAKYRSGPPLCGQLLLTPMLDATLSMRSDRAAPGVPLFDGAPPFTMKAAKSYWSAYAPDPEQRSHPMVSPAQSRISLLRDLPPACVITGENDPVRDEGELYARKLQEAGVEVTAACYLGCSHDFLLRRSLTGRLMAHDALALAASALARFTAHAPAAPPRRGYRPLELETLALVAAT